MINTTEDTQPAIIIAIHYAQKLNSNLATQVFQSGKDISTKEEAAELTIFFWNMLDEAVTDQENNIEIAGVYDLEHWMEKLMNITIGYLSRRGFKDEWTKISNQLNHHD